MKIRSTRSSSRSLTLAFGIFILTLLHNILLRVTCENFRTLHCISVKVHQFCIFFRSIMVNSQIQKSLVKSNAKKLPQYIAAVSVCLGSVAAGTVLGWTANITNQLKAGDLRDIKITDDHLGWIGSFATLGAMVMCFPIGKICDWIGRKWAMLLTVLPFTLGWLLIIFADNVDMIYAGRFFTGLAGGAFCVAAPLYTSEIAETEIRGRLGSFFQLLLTVGILLAYLLPLITGDPLIHTIICAVFPLIFGVLFFLQPETPVYLLKKHKEEEAKASLQRLRGKNYDIQPEITVIKEALAEEEKNNVPFLQAIKTTAAKKASLIIFGLMFFQQMGGINAVVFYTGEIFTQSGVELDDQVATVIIGSVQVVATLCSSLVVDKLGRKILLLISAFFMAVGGILLGAFFTLQQRDLVSADTLNVLGFLPILALCIFMIVFSLGFGPIPWMLSAEVFPPEIKAIASSSAGTFNWFLAFIVTRFYIDVTNAIGGDITFYIFATLSLLGTAFVFIFVPETKGKSFEEIQRILGGGKLSKSKGVDNLAYDK